MRPPEFTGGKVGGAAMIVAFPEFASMRPPEFTGGKQSTTCRWVCIPICASMRPPEFTGGKPGSGWKLIASTARFNEAAGIHRRKGESDRAGGADIEHGFNEAAGIHRRKDPCWRAWSCWTGSGFNEAAGIHRREPTSLDAIVCTHRPGAIASMRPPEFTGGNAGRYMHLRIAGLFEELQ